MPQSIAGTPCRARRLTRALTIIAALLFLAVIFAVFIEPRLLSNPAASAWSRAKYLSPQNPYQHYRAAASLLSKADRDALDYYQLQQSGHLPHDVKPITQTQYRQALIHLQPAIAKFMIGAKLAPVDFQLPRKDYLPNTIFPEYEELRTLARFVMVDANTKLAAGQPQAAISELLALTRMANQAGRGPSIQGASAYREISAIGTVSLQRAIGQPSLGAADYRRIGRGLEDAYRLRPSLRAAIENEARYQQAKLDAGLSLGKDANQLFHDYISDREATPLPDLSQEPTQFRATRMILAGTPGLKLGITHSFAKTWQAAGIATGKPYPDAIKFRMDDFGTKHGLICGGAGTALVALNDHTLVLADQLGVTLMAALEAYRLEQDRYPASLSELVKGRYISQIPTDPFTRNQPFIYRKAADKYLLYSVGFNQKDDGGRAHRPKMFDQSYQGDILFVPGRDIWGGPVPQPANNR